MLSTSELRLRLERLFLELPESFRTDLSIQFGYCSPLHGVIDVVISRGDQCMALGRFRPVSENGPGAFGDRFRMAMGYPADTWYLFDFDGARMVINDLSENDPADEFTEYIGTGFRRLCTLPAEWKEERKTLTDMKHFLEAMRFLIDEETLLNPVK